MADRFRQEVMENTANQERRSNNRKTTSLSAIVKGQEGDEVFWKETTVLSTVTKNGASFNLNRECSVGRIILLTTVIPKELRCYDIDNELYMVWGLIQHCTPITTEDYTGYHIGVAFIGKESPSSFKKNPLTSYRISGLNEDGLWKVFEAERAFIIRKYARFSFNLSVNICSLNSKGKILKEEKTSTINISRSGAAVVSTLDVSVGDHILFNCSEHNFFSKSIVCNRKKIGDSLSSLHLQFIDNEFPIRDLFPMQRGIETGFRIMGNGFT